MNKKLLKQIRNEWRSNLLLFVEFLLVSVIMWYVVDYSYGYVATYFSSRGYDIDHCYKVQMGWLGDKSASFDPTDDSSADNVEELVERLRRRPEIEAVSLSQASHPYNMNKSGTSVQYDSMMLSRSANYVVKRVVSPDYLRVFRYEGARGETPEQLAALLNEHNFLASDNLFSEYDVQLTSLINKPFYIDGDTTKSYPLAAALKEVRYEDFGKGDKSIVRKLTWSHNSLELCVRVKADQDHDFVARLKADSEAQYRIGNLFIADVKDFKDLRRIFQQGSMNEIRNAATGMAFLLINVFLGLLGTFWFRTQQRKGEIALHMAMGATRSQVFTRLLSEGFLILLLATALSMLICFNLTVAEITEQHDGKYFEIIRFTIGTLITFGLIATMIVLGIWVPARKAMKVEPAEALHNE